MSKTVGTTAIDGAINGANAVTGQVTATGDSTYRARVIESVREAQNARSQIVGHREKKIEELQLRAWRSLWSVNGTNKAPALVQADLSVAIGAGTKVAASGRSNPRDVAAILVLSRATYRKIGAKSDLGHCISMPAPSLRGYTDIARARSGDGSTR